MRSDARANRDKVLAAAEEIFGTAGADASTDDVARRAGVGIGTVFRHFPTKRDLLEATVVRHFEQLTEEVSGAGTTLDDALRRLISTGATKIALINRLVALDEFSAPAERASKALKAAVRARLREEQEAGVIRPDVTVEEVYLLVRALANVATTVDPSTVDRAVEVILDGLKIADRS